MSDGTLQFLGVMAAFLGVVTVHDARKRHGRITLSGWVFAAVGGYGVYTNQDLFRSSSNLRYVVLAFLFLAMSPLLGFLIYWGNGKVLKGILRTVLFLIIGVLGAAGYLVIVEPENVLHGVIFGVALAILLAFPTRAIWRKWKRKWTFKSQMRQEKKARVLRERQEQEEKAQKEREKRDFLEMVVRELKE